MKSLITLVFLFYSISIICQDLAHVQNVDEPNSISQEQIILSGYTWLTNTDNIQACNPQETKTISIKPLNNPSSPSNSFMQIDHYQHNNSMVINVNLLDEATLLLKDSDGHTVFKTKLHEGRQEQTIYMDSYQINSVYVSLVTPTEIVNREVKINR